MALIENISIGVTVLTGGLTKGFKKADGLVQGFAAKVSGIGKSLSAGLTSALPTIGPPMLSLVSMIGNGLVTACKVALAGVVALYSGLALLAIRSVGVVGAQQDLADQLGTTQGVIAGLQYAFALGGSSAEEVGAAIKKLNVNLANEPEGVKTALDALGLSAAKLRSMSPDEQMATIADALQGVADPATRAALAVDLFGKAGVGLLPTLNAGGQAIRDAGKEAEKLGLSLSAVDASNIAQMGDNADRMGSVFTGIGNQVAAMVAPAFNNLADMVMLVLTKTTLVQDGIKFLVDIGVAGIGILIEVVHKLGVTFAQVFIGASKALQGMIEGIDFLFRKIDEFFRWVDGREGKTKFFTQDWAEDLNKYNTEAQAALNEEWNRTPGADLEQWFQNLQTSARKTGEEIKKSVDPLDETILKMAEAKQKGLDYIKGLKEQQYELLNGKEAADRYKLGQEGVSQSMLYQIETLQKEVKALEAKKKKDEEMKKEADKVRESLLSDEQKAGVKIKDLTELLLGGKISDEDYNKAVAKIQKDLQGETKLAGAADFGSQAARSAILRHQMQTKDPVAVNTAAIVKNTAAMAKGFAAFAKQKVEAFAGL